MHLRPVPAVTYRRERVITPDRDYLYLDWVHRDPKHLVILSHGIAGDSQTTYTRGMAKAFADENWSILAWNMRGRGSEKTNWHHKNYHLGFTDDLRFIVDYAISKGFEKVILIGFSLGANIVLKFLGEESKNLSPAVKGSIAFSAPIDVVSCGERIDRAPTRFYTSRILRELVNSIVAKISLLTPFVDVDRLLKVKNWREFDEIYTAPVYGFQSVLDYRRQAGAKPFLPQIQVPTLLINAKDDPLLSPECRPEDSFIKEHPHLFCEFPEHGGHLGFVCFEKKGFYWSENRSIEFVKSIL